MRELRLRVRQFLFEEAGATMLEYAIMVSLIALVCVAAVGLIGPIVDVMFQAVLPGL